MKVGPPSCIVPSVAALKNRGKITGVARPLVQPEDGGDRTVPVPKISTYVAKNRDSTHRPRDTNSPFTGTQLQVIENAAGSVAIRRGSLHATSTAFWSERLPAWLGRSPRLLAGASPVRGGGDVHTRALEAQPLRQQAHVDVGQEMFQSFQVAAILDRFLL